MQNIWDGNNVLTVKNKERNELHVCNKTRKKKQDKNEQWNGNLFEYSQYIVFWIKLRYQKQIIYMCSSTWYVAYGTIFYNFYFSLKVLKPHRLFSKKKMCRTWRSSLELHIYLYDRILCRLHQIHFFFLIITFRMNSNSDV